MSLSLRHAVGPISSPSDSAGLLSIPWKGHCVTLRAGVTKGYSLKDSCAEPPREQSADGHCVRGATRGRFRRQQARSPLLPAGAADVSADGPPDNCGAEVTSSRGAQTSRSRDQPSPWRPVRFPTHRTHEHDETVLFYAAELCHNLQPGKSHWEARMSGVARRDPPKVFPKNVATCVQPLGPQVINST